MSPEAGHPLHSPEAGFSLRLGSARTRLPPTCSPALGRVRTRQFEFKVDSKEICLFLSHSHRGAKYTDCESDLPNHLWVHVAARPPPGFPSPLTPARTRALSRARPHLPRPASRRAAPTPAQPRSGHRVGRGLRRGARARWRQEPRGEGLRFERALTGERGPRAYAEGRSLPGTEAPRPAFGGDGRFWN